ncbi:MAG: hypothetical protein IJ174_01975 [Clostridia bacterium]|nr:hypothetical protein [Clostridia bacterium]
MSLLKNPFALLNASPRDSREALLERADEAALLSGHDPDKALSDLLHPGKRLRAELAWMPNTEKPAANAILARLGEDHPTDLAAQLPQGLGCPLAEANALAALCFQSPAPLYDEIPKEKPALTFKSLLDRFVTSFIGSLTTPPEPPSTVLRVEETISPLLKLNQILRRITLEETLSAVNEDRKKGDWEPIKDQAAFAAMLDEQLQTICSLATACIQTAKTDEDAGKLAAAFAESPDTDEHDTLVIALVNAYLLRIQEEKEKVEAYVTLQDPPCMNEFGVLRVLRFETWWGIVCPIRPLDPQIQHLSKVYANDVLETISKCFYSAPKTTKQVSDKIFSQKGLHVFTVTYQTVSEEAVAKASDNVRRLMALFPDDDQDILGNMILTLDGFEMEYSATMRRAENELRRAMWKQEKEYREHPPETLFYTRTTEIKMED